MKMNILNSITDSFRWLFLLFLCVTTVTLQAENPDAAGAKQFAETFFKANTPQFAPGKIVQKPVIKQCYQSPGYKKAPVFVFQNSDKGFAVVAQRNSNFNLVGYAPEGKFNSDSIPVQLSYNFV